MPHVTIEYVIMVPVLVLQIFLFPLTANWLMNIWVDSRRTLVLQEAASQLGSTIQQIYFALNHATISTGTVTQKSNVPSFIENYPYTGNATLRTILDPALNSSKILEITLRLKTAGTIASTSVILGQNVLWQESTFISNSTNACIRAEKLANGTISLFFGG
ncbi:MAG: hypothetical protein OEY22_03655 [Candidatus Bathyarchaeota archaeon]|nr:hypothetical protein [Candidatus Bathyarchaeota archaeon]MDH5787863.1 hypothetical protein [Candidatus Bathyarchaeota archaeon]